MKDIHKKKFNARVERDASDESEAPEEDAEEHVSGAKYGHRKIQSNWSRYEEPAATAVETPKASDFESLLKAPAQCNYFQFKSEKNWETEAANSSFRGRKFFDLDLEVLDKGLASIPFYKRAGIDRDLLTEKDASACDKKASESEERYEVVKKKFLNKLESEYQLVDESPKENESEARQVPSTKSPSEEEKIAEKMIKALTVTPSDASNVSAEVNNSDEENLEDWLDSVLDD